jgi:hypothetical protein
MGVGPENETAPGALGFLTVVCGEELGLVGGYLILNPAGRPLEFHCTVPIKPNRAQQILYGPTLEPFLYGEQIGRTLVEKGSTAVQLLLTDVEPMLCLRPLVTPPVALVRCGDAAHGGVEGAARGGVEARGGGHAVTIAGGDAGDRAKVEAVLSAIGDRIDLPEPFGRIREAIAEAQREAKPRPPAAPPCAA